MVERRQQDPGPEPDAIGRCCQRGQRGEQRRHVSVPGAVVLADPCGIESEGLGQPNHVQDLPVLLGEGPVRAGGNLGGEEPDPDLNCHRGQTLPQWIVDARSGSPNGPSGTVPGDEGEPVRPFFGFPRPARIVETKRREGHDSRTGEKPWIGFGSGTSWPPSSAWTAFAARPRRGPGI